MMGERRVMQEALFYGFSLERHVPDDHLLRKIDRFVDLSELRAYLGPYYSETGRPSIDPELMMRMLIVGYCFGIRSERRLMGWTAPRRHRACQDGRCHEPHLEGSVWTSIKAAGATPNRNGGKADYVGLRRMRDRPRGQPIGTARLQQIEERV
jgi:Transposase domain (DUF772)